jgi:hypothetical protein
MSGKIPPLCLKLLMTAMIPGERIDVSGAGRSEFVISNAGGLSKDLRNPKE